MTGDGNDISLYFHIPFCSKKCPYCHFFVLPNEEGYKKTFEEALLKEWALRIPQLQGKRIISIYFGGGTPTKLEPSRYQRILEKICHSKIDLSSDCEITLEANPEDISIPLIQEYRALGIDRVSLGVQSLFEQDLILLGRTHTANRAMQAVQIVHDAGIANISIDLMFELPNQIIETWKKTLQSISKLPLTHLSLYNLTFEPQTVFFKKQHQLMPRLPSEEDRLQMLQMAVEALESMGLERYEISAFAKPGKQSRHNMGYWTGRTFFGFGPSAFSYWEGARFSNVANLNKYVNILNQNRFPVDFKECLPHPDNLKELLAVRLRLFEGVDLKHFAAIYGPLPKIIEQCLCKMIENGWIEQKGDAVKLTALGQLFYDSVAAEIVCA